MSKRLNDPNAIPASGEIQIVPDSVIVEKNVGTHWELVPQDKWPTGIGDTVADARREPGFHSWTDGNRSLYRVSSLCSATPETAPKLNALGKESLQALKDLEKRQEKGESRATEEPSPAQSCERALWDQFAVAVLPAFITIGNAKFDDVSDPDGVYQWAAEHTAKTADAMLKARAERFDPKPPAEFKEFIAEISSNAGETWQFTSSLSSDLPASIVRALRNCECGEWAIGSYFYRVRIKSPPGETILVKYQTYSGGPWTPMDFRNLPNAIKIKAYSREFGKYPFGASIYRVEPTG